MLQGWIHTVCTQRRQTMPAYHMSLHHGFCIGFRNIQQMWHRHMMITIPKMPKSSPTSPGWPLLYFGGPPPPARWTLGWTFFKRSLGCCMKVLAWNHQLAPSCSNGLLCPGGESLPNSNGPCPDTWPECVQAAESFFFFPCLNPKTWPTRFVSDTFVGLENYQLWQFVSFSVVQNCVLKNLPGSKKNLQPPKSQGSSLSMAASNAAMISEL